MVSALFWAAFFAAGDTLGYVGTGCFLVASVAITAATALSAGWWAAPGGIVLLAATVSFIDSHIFWPHGVFTMVGIAGMFLLGQLVSPVDPGDARS